MRPVKGWFTLDFYTQKNKPTLQLKKSFASQHFEV
jgi:hypothetical protein